MKREGFDFVFCIFLIITDSLIFLFVLGSIHERPCVFSVTER